jgi:leader peptidase (prepilin peptidase)/N-methyltransferase
MEEMARVLALVWGGCLGSFINVVAYRLPREESLVRPASRCPNCQKPIRWWDNIPLLGWLIVGGRCRHCRKPVSPRYPAVETFMAVLSLALWLRWESRPAFAVAAVLAAGALTAVALIDWDTFLIPDELSVGLAAAGVLASPLNPYFEALSWPGRMGQSLLGAALGFGLCWAVAAAGELAFKKEAMGGGDVKLMAGIGAWTGGVGAFDALMAGSLLGSLYGLSLILRGRLKRSDPIPFGPFLSAGAVFAFFLRLPLGWPFIP